MISGTRSGRASATLAITVTALLCLTFVIGSTADEEEFRFAVLSSWLHLDALRHGSLGLWTPLLGLGVPQLFVPNFRLHPLLPILAVLSPPAWARLLLLTHTLLGALGMWQLTRYLRLTGVVRAACVATFLLATPAQNYALTDFWLSHYIVWTSAPWLLLFAWRMLEANGRRLAFWSVALGLTAGLVTADANPGHIIVYAILAVAVVVTRWHHVVARWHGAVLAGLIAAAIAAPNLLQLAHERTFFPPELPFGFGDQSTPLPPAAALNAFLSPFGIATGEWSFSRTLFFGGPFAVLAILGLVLSVRRHLDLAIVVIVGTLLLFTSFVPLPLVSARFHVRDPLTLSAILLAGVALDRLAAGRMRAWVVSVIVPIQLAVLMAAAWPALARAWSADAQRAQWFRGATGEVGAIDELTRLARPPGRMLFAPSLDETVFDNSRIEQGLGPNSLAYRGLAVVNGWFKGVSTDAVSPDERLFYGRISTPQQLVESPASLSLLGIRWVLATGDDRVSPELRKAAGISLSNGEQLTLFENPHVLPGGFILEGEAATVMTAAFPGCKHRRLLCMDLAPLYGVRLHDVVAVARHGDTLNVRVSPSAATRLLVLSEMFRPDWVAAAGSQSLRTVAAVNSLLAVQVPAGVTVIQLRYRPVPLMTAMVVAWLTAAAGAVALIVLRNRHALPENGGA